MCPIVSRSVVGLARGASSERPGRRRREARALMTRRIWRGWRCAAAAALVLGAASASLASDARTLLAKAEGVGGAGHAFTPAGDLDAGRYQLMDTQLEYPAPWRVAQASGAP